MITLRPIEDCDRAEIVKVLMNDRVKQTYMLPDFATEQDAEPLFCRLRDLSQNLERYIRGICLNERCIGFLNDPEITGDAIELGWAIHPDYHNRGYATRAVKLAITELFQRGFRQVKAGAFSENPASIRVMEKSGMQKLQFEEEIEYRGKTHHCVYYAIEK